MRNIRSLAPSVQHNLHLHAMRLRVVYRGLCHLQQNSLVHTGIEGDIQGGVYAAPSTLRQGLEGVSILIVCASGQLWNDWRQVGCTPPASLEQILVWCLLPHSYT